MNKLLLTFVLTGVMFGQSSSDANAAAPSVRTEGPLGRWLSLDNMSFSSRYRNSAATNGNHVFNGGQQRSLISGKFKFDREGKYFIGFRASSGRYFNWAYASMAGTHFGNGNAPLSITPAVAGTIVPLIGRGAPIAVPEARGWNFYMRELYLSASPTKFLTMEFGSFGIERGVASEITTFDDDGYLSGERVRLKDKQHLYLDEISATFAYLAVADLNTPNFFARGTDLGKNNYRQVAATKTFGKRVAVSAQYDWLARFQTVREAAKVNIGESKVLDSTRLELYQRVNAAPQDFGIFPAANGWSLSAAKNLGKKQWQLEGGYANVDRYYGVYGGSQIGTLAGFSINGDSYQTGERLFARANYTPHPFVTLFGFYTHELNPARDAMYNGFNKQNVQGGLTLNFKAMLDRTGLF